MKTICVFLTMIIVLTFIVFGEGTAYASARFEQEELLANVFINVGQGTPSGIGEAIQGLFF